MTRRCLQILSVVFVVVLGGAMVCQAAGVKTDKAEYTYGEAIQVTFSGAPGLDSDWICVAPAGSPDTEAGDYKYLPKGPNSGTLTFDPPAPGKYEVRAFYNYQTLGYTVGARAAFSVTGEAEYAKAMEQRMERKLDPADPFEAKVPSGSGVIYIFREPWSGSATIDVEVLSKNKPVVVLGHTDYYPLVVGSGQHQFQTGSLFNSGTKSVVAGRQTGEAAVQVKPGYAYYLRVKVVPLAAYDNYLDLMPHQEGAEQIKSYKLNLRK